jgi:hypothetical protein
MHLRQSDLHELGWGGVVQADGNASPERLRIAWYLYSRRTGSNFDAAIQAHGTLGDPGAKSSRDW